MLTDDGKVTSVAFRERLDAHKLIEEFMILANVAAAEELIRLKRPLLFRVHEEPSPEKLDALREVAEASGFTLAKGQVLKTAHLNRLLAQAEGTEFDELMNITTLRVDDAGLLPPGEFRPFRAGAAELRAFHLADPALFRPDRAPRADRGAWLGRGRAVGLGHRECWRRPPS